MSMPHDVGGPLELSETALKLSMVIEREAKRRSALRHTSFTRVTMGASSFGRHTKADRSHRSNNSRRSVSVLPTPVEVSAREETSQPRVTETVETKTAVPKVSMTRQESSRRGSETQSMADSFMEGSEGWRHTVWIFFEEPQSSVAAYYFSMFLFACIAVSTVVFIIETEAFFRPYATEMAYIETSSAIIFTFELLSRFIVCPSKSNFLQNYSNWIDMAAVFPFYLEVVLNVQNASTFGAIRIVRLTRVARVLKMSRYSSAIQVFTQAIAISFKPLSMLLFLMGIAMVVFSSAIYFAEFTPDGCRAGGWMGQCDDNVSDTGVKDLDSVSYSSSVASAVAAVEISNACVCVDPNPYAGIASSFWWCIVTMSTVGYGDMTPVTWIGKVVGCTTVLTGMLVLALPITVIGTNFQKVMKSVMHQTMKSNVDYLKGKRMLCRNEIEAILQRFHAVTEDIHLDIDDVINVYDTDNSGMLEDDELAKFRHDLEVLQNRAFLNQLVVPGAGLHSSRQASGTYHRTAVTAVTTPTSTPAHSPTKTSHMDELGRRHPVVPYSALGTRPSITLVGLGTPGQKAAESEPLPAIPTAEVASFPGSRTQLPQLNGVNEVRPAVTPLVDDQLLLRLLEMQQGLQDRLMETEQRLETKLLNLTKILMRLEGMMELED